MKSLFVAASLSVVALAAPAFAQVQAPVTPHVYGNIGYANVGPGSAELDTIQGRLGYRFNNWFGVEGELAGGIGGDKRSVAPGIDQKLKLRHQEAIYGVGFFPLTEQWELLGRVGYGNTRFKVSEAGFSDSFNEQSWNFGAGVQYHLDGQNGIRADYTRHEYENDGGDADVWSIGYSRRF